MKLSKEMKKYLKLAAFAAFFILVLLATLFYIELYILLSPFRH